MSHIRRRKKIRGRMGAAVLVIGITCLLSACNAGTGYQGMNKPSAAASTSAEMDRNSTFPPSCAPQISGFQLTSDSQQTTQQQITDQQQTVDQQQTADQQQITDQQQTADLRQLLSKMSLDEKVGQLFIVGFKGEKVNQEVTDMVKKYHVGGIILFRNNISSTDQLLTLVNSIKNLNRKSKAPLFLSIDEEGGRISRMPDQLEKLPSNKIVGERKNEEVSERIGAALAYELKEFGLNMDFAPVLDIFSNPQNTVIGDRAFGTEPDIVSRLGIQTMKAIQAGGVAPVVKHFPGHGDTLVDSHKGLPVVSYGMERLESFELKPFQAAIDNGADAVMCAHILMNSIDSLYPASMSEAVITDLLRKKMGFGGIVISDDMTMGAITDHYQIGDAAVRSVTAGCDILLVCHGYENQKNVFNAVKEAVRKGTITKEQLDEKVYRILEMKRKYQISDERIHSADVDGINRIIREINADINAGTAGTAANITNTATAATAGSIKP